MNIGLLGCSIAVLAVAACGGAEAEAPEPTRTTPQAEPTPASYEEGLAAGENGDPSEFEKCPYPERQPRYLPWLSANEAVPPPIRDRSWGYSSFFWTSEGFGQEWRAVTENDTKVVPYLRLSSYTSPGGSGPGAPVPPLDGVPGYMYDATQPGGAAILWDSSDRCGSVALELETLGRLPQREVERELRRVAESLTK